ncbi:hypothetical protein MM300_19345 [Evansella sp. LMS18]|jgi:hypothetical protein|uniref:hypothetical protein n=1 Tax=Evansella sp. LMS18 TaxID=2924033 RepID=UPI0020D16841|nr:hypothetical protein [Evansella sp. LMS18]UTR10009.1 hypothetical protein MM300_19345 [Evansella sp. LMS18]
MGWLFYWRIIVLITFVTLYLTNVISSEIFLSFIIGITVFYGIPELFKFLKKDICNRKQQARRENK